MTLKGSRVKGFEVTARLAALAHQRGAWRPKRNVAGQSTSGTAKRRRRGSRTILDGAER